MDKCDLCGAPANNSKLCRACRENPHVATLHRVYEVVGINDYTHRQITGLKNNLCLIVHLIDELLELNQHLLGSKMAIPKITPELLAVLLAWRTSVFRGDGEHNEAFELEATLFERSTGKMRPGKDQPGAMGEHPTDQERQECWDEWCKRLGELRDAHIQGKINKRRM